MVLASRRRLILFLIITVVGITISFLSLSFVLTFVLLFGLTMNMPILLATMILIFTLHMCIMIRLTLVSIVIVHSLFVASPWTQFASSKAYTVGLTIFHCTSDRPAAKSGRVWVTAYCILGIFSLLVCVYSYYVCSC